MTSQLQISPHQTTWNTLYGESVTDKFQFGFNLLDHPAQMEDLIAAFAGAPKTPDAFIGIQTAEEPSQADTDAVAIMVQKSAFDGRVCWKTSKAVHPIVANTWPKSRPMNQLSLFSARKSASPIRLSYQAGALVIDHGDARWSTPHQVEKKSAILSVGNFIKKLQDGLVHLRVRSNAGIHLDETFLVHMQPVDWYLLPTICRACNLTLQKRLVHVRIPLETHAPKDQAGPIYGFAILAIALVGLGGALEMKSRMPLAIALYAIGLAFFIASPLLARRVWQKPPAATQSAPLMATQTAPPWPR